MQVELVSKFENKLLKRVEYIFKINHDGKGTPSRKEVKEAIAKHLGVPLEKLVIRKIRTPFGINEALVDAIYYEDIEWLKKIEPKHILIREGLISKEGE